ncbi:GrpB family protein [Aliterella atlantica]|uniref:GrpB family protein n=1 Tax=Aliterella atlantica TaxID=1827278 RepID=UPI0006965E3C|nr:GrpB family protein [Aliterella atlantica]
MEDPIVIVDYDANWYNQYEQEKSQILAALGDTIADIQHIGSTSVPGLAAKPIIDILLGLKEIPPTQAQVLSLEHLGYQYFGEFGIPQRYYFRRGMPRTHQIHAVQVDSDFWHRHILFRDFLRSHPQAAQQYEALKRKLAEEFRHDAIAIPIVKHH